MGTDIKDLFKKWEQLNKVVSVLSDKLNSYEKNSMGLTIESVRLSKEYKQIAAKYNEAFKDLQEFNKSLTKKQQKELVQLKRKRKRGILKTLK